MPKKDPQLGRLLIKAHKKLGKNMVAQGFRHTRDLDDGRDFGRLNLKSVTQQTSIDDFLDKAAVAEKEFIAEMSNIKIVDSSNTFELSEEEKAILSSAQARSKEILCIPRRPHWDIEKMSKQEIDSNEIIAFNLWKKKLAYIQEEEHIKLTHYERNMEVWRQLWRVIERSDVLVQILDARNPLLFRCEDLEAYVKEVNENKVNVLLLNKADFLTESQRKGWSDYFQSQDIQIVFYSALLEGQKKDSEEEELVDIPDIDLNVVKNSPDILSRDNLLRFFKSLSIHTKCEKHVPTVGLVGYPNVGKSCTINSLLMSKRVCVSATPGKTKHFQTFIIDDDLKLCDCPGLVFPNLVSTKAEMVVNGVLPIDQLTEWMHPVSLVIDAIPRYILEHTYSLLISTPGESRNSNSKPTAGEFLDAHGLNRGYMTQKGGLPDRARSARYILKDFVNGKLLYCKAPPNIEQELYHTFPEVARKTRIPEDDGEIKFREEDLEFFRMVKAHKMGLDKQVEPDVPGKPWKKHNNRNKREKTRRVYQEYK